ncbi:MAG: 30S ribosomal protein S7 [Candidatus Bathyarchaeota archaeon]
MILSQETKNSEPQIKLFGKWNYEGIEVQDPGLKRYLYLKPVWLPHSSGRHEHQRFDKSEVNIVERLANNMMRHGISGGKKAKALNIVRLAFEIINLKTERNPIEVLVKAIENSSPCEDTTRVGRGGIVYHRAVDISPQRRVDLALRFLADGTRATSGNPKSVEECLADELIAAAERDTRSYAVSHRDEMERVALSSR